MTEQNTKPKLGFFSLFALFALAFVVFYWGLDRLPSAYFDEVHYLTAIRQWLGNGGDPIKEHPPLGRIAIGISMRFLGDTPLAWRLPSLLAGAWSAVILGLIGMTLSHSTRGYWITGILGIVSGGLLVFSRIAMLDGIATCFLLMTFYCLVNALDEKQIDIQSMRHAGFYMGCSLATKWSGLPFWGMTFFFLLYQSIRDRTGMKLWDLVVHWIIHPLFVYAIVYFFWVYKTEGLSWSKYAESLTTLQVQIFNAMGTATTDHPYRSLWWEWPYQARPTWFLFEPLKENPKQVHAVLFWMNPMVLFFGLLSLLGVGWSGFKEKATERVFVFFAFIAFWLSWAFTTRETQFFYYYYSAAMILTASLGVWLSEMRVRWLAYLALGISVGLFIFYYPILSGSIIDRDSFTKWMWSSNWI